MNLHEDAIASSLAQEWSNAIDAELLIAYKYKDYNKLDCPPCWYFTNTEMKKWINEMLPDCFYHNNTLYYKNAEDATLFKLKYD